jgi:two-component system, OmpR family, response regulator QseB
MVEGSPPARKHKPMMIVDDEREIGEAFAEMFEPNFEKVVVCSSAEEAIAAIGGTVFSIILCDLNLPGLSGDQMVMSLRSSGNLTPIMFMTGDATMSCLRMALKLGVSDVIEKPFDPDAVLLKIDRILEIEKCRQKLYADIERGVLNEQEIQKEKQHLGLLLVANKEGSPS